LWHISVAHRGVPWWAFAVASPCLTKNAFLDEIRKQYVLTARGGVYRRGACLEAQSSATRLLPLIVGFPGAFIGAFFTGSLLIETLFHSMGLGMLSYESVVRRDYPVVLGTLYSSR